jgi:integrase
MATYKKIEKHLFARQYQNADGNWSTVFYAKFTDWKGTPRVIALGADLKIARDKLGEIHQLNGRKFDFDAERRERKEAKVKAITVAEWLDHAIELEKSKPSYCTKKSQSIPLKRLLGHLTLSEVSKVRIIEYKNRRGSECLLRGGKEVPATRIKGSTINREVSCLVAALNLAADEGLCEAPPRIKKERETTRERTLTAKEYQTLLDVSPRWSQRVIIAASETGFDQGVILRLTWDSVKDGLIKVQGGRSKTGARQIVGISPALQTVLDELKAEYRKTPNMEKRVFTREAKPIPKDTLRTAFDAAIAKAKIDDFQFRDFRHCSRTRWAAGGLPFEIAELALGHKIHGIAGKYINLGDDHVREAFQNFWNKTGTQEKIAARTLITTAAKS